MKIQALHDFSQKDNATQWAGKFSPTAERLELFSLMRECIIELPQRELHVLELGIGPGYLTDYLLEHLSHVIYQGVDFSWPMIEIAQQRLSQYDGRIEMKQLDLTDDHWTREIRQVPDVVVSTWALHDLLSVENIQSVYSKVYSLLPVGGMLLNGDFIKPEGVAYEYEAGRITIRHHIKLLEGIGFKSVECLQEFETNLIEPTTANNYACIRAVK